MRPKTKQSGSKARLRPALLLAALAALLLVPAAGASAAPDTFIVFEGEGSGWVKTFDPLDPISSGKPAIKCHWDGAAQEIDIGTGGEESGTEAQAGKCETEAQTSSENGLTGIQVTQEADPGSVFVDWEILEGGASISCDSGSCSVIGPPIKIKAIFEPAFALNLSTSGEGSGSFQCDTGSGPEACQTEYAQGTEVEVIANSDAGSALLEFTGDCSGQSCELTMDEEHSVGAIFEPAFALNLSTSGEGTGSLQCDSGSGPGACQAEYAKGAEVEVIALPDPDSEFAGWSGDCAGTGACEVTMDEERSVDALFDLIPTFALNLSISGSGSGSLQCDSGSGAGACAAEYAEGTEVEVIAKASAGSEFAGWSGDCAGTGACEVTMDEERSVGALFEEVKEDDDDNGGDNDGSSTPPPPPPPPPPLPSCLTNPALCAPGALIANGLAPVKGNKALLRVRCRGEQGARCRGVLKLIARVKVRGKARNIVVGKSRHNLPTNSAVRLLRAKLTGQGMRLLRRAGRRGLKAKLLGRGVRNRVVKLKPANSKKKRKRARGRRS